MKHNERNLSELAEEYAAKDVYDEQDPMANACKLDDDAKTALLARVNNHIIKLEGPLMDRFFVRKSGEIKGVRPGDLAAWLIFAHCACLIDKEPSFLEYPKGDTRNTNLYYQGDDGLMRVLQHYWPNIRKADATAVYNSLQAELLHKDEYSFTSDLTTFVTRDGTIFRVNPIAKDPDDVINIIDEIMPEDHVLAGSCLPVDYQPNITSHDLVDRVFDEWADGDYARRLRFIEAHYSTPLVRLIGKKKGLVIDIDEEGGAGKSLNADLMDAFLGFGSVLSIGNINSIDGRFTTGQAAPARVIYSDECPSGALKDSSANIIKSLVTGRRVAGEKKGVQELVPCLGQSVIVSTNHPIKPSQNEAVLNAWARRICVIRWNRVFDTYDPAQNTADDTLLYRITSDEGAMSYILNLALEGLRRFIVNGWYTPVPEDDEFGHDMLLGADTVRLFLEEYGDPYGSDWGGMPRLLPYGPRGMQTALVYPTGMWHEAKEHYDKLSRQGGHYEGTHYRGTPLARVLDTRLGSVDTYMPHRIDAVGFSNDFKIFYGCYQAWHVTQGMGDRGCLSNKSVVGNLARKGYTRYNCRMPFGSQGRIIVPKGITTAEAFKDFVTSKQAAHLASKAESCMDERRFFEWCDFAKSTLSNSPSCPTMDSPVFTKDGHFYVSNDELAQLSQRQLFELARVAIGLGGTGLLG